MTDPTPALRAAAITVSDRVSAGSREDRSGPVLTEALREAGWDVTLTVVPDGADSVAAAITQAVTDGARVVVTTGGTGLSPRDRTPEGTRAVVSREVPGIPALLLQEGLQHTPYAALSRGIAGVVDAGGGHGPAFVVNLPGSTSGVREGCEVLIPLLPHIAEQIEGGDH